MKLIFCDMDGTLLNHHLKITPYTKDKLIELEEKGIGIILSSGRHIESLKKYGEELHFEKYPQSGYSCTNGLTAEKRARLAGMVPALPRCPIQPPYISQACVC